MRKLIFPLLSAVGALQVFAFVFDFLRALFTFFCMFSLDSAIMNLSKENETNCCEKGQMGGQKAVLKNTSRD